MLIELRIKQQKDQQNIGIFSFSCCCISAASAAFPSTRSCSSCTSPVFSFFLCCRTLGSAWLRRNGRVRSLEGCPSSTHHQRGHRLLSSAQKPARSWRSGWTRSTSTSSTRVSVSERDGGGVCVNVQGAETRVEDSLEKHSGKLNGHTAYLLSVSLSPPLAENQASGYTAATS